MEYPVRVLHVLGKRPVGGVGTFLINMHKNIDRSKVQFDYLMNASYEEGEFDKTVKSLGGNVYILPELSYKNTLSYLKNLNVFFKKYNLKYNIIHVHSVNIGIFNFMLAKKYGIKYRIAHSHSSRYSDSFFKSLRNFLLQIPINRLSNIYFACSKKASDFLFGEKNYNKVYIAKNAIETEKFIFDEDIRNDLRKKMNIEGKFVIGHIGAFLPVKNHEFIIDVFSEVYKNNQNAILILIGDGKLKEDMERKVKLLNLEKKVMFLGARTDVNKLMNVLDIFILPSLFEGMPLVGIEAQTNGLPCIFSESITKEIKIINNVRFKSIDENYKSWALEICNYEGLKRDNNSAKQVIEAGYDVKEVSNKLQDFYINLE